MLDLFGSSVHGAVFCLLLVVTKYKYAECKIWGRIIEILNKWTIHNIKYKFNFNNYSFVRLYARTMDRDRECENSNLVNKSAGDQVINQKIVCQFYWVYRASCLSSPFNKGKWQYLRFHVSKWIIKFSISICLNQICITRSDANQSIYHYNVAYYSIGVGFNSSNKIIIFVSRALKCDDQMNANLDANKKETDKYSSLNIFKLQFADYY